MIGELNHNIEDALDAELWSIALVAALALPDICGALDSQDGKATGKSYGAWFATNLGNKYRSLDPADVYKLRCSVLHQGRSRAKFYSRILFTIPRPPRLHNVIINDTLNLDIDRFCRDVVHAARTWYVEHLTDSHVRRNRDKMMKWHPNGLPPYIVGIPVLS